MGVLQLLVALSLGALCVVDSEAKMPLSSPPEPGDEDANVQAKKVLPEGAEADGDEEIAEDEDAGEDEDLPEGKQTEQDASSHEAALAGLNPSEQTTQDLENLNGNVAIGRGAEENEGHLVTEEESADVAKFAPSGLEAQETSRKDSAVAAASQEDSGEDFASLSGDEFYNSLYDAVDELKAFAQEAASALITAAAAADDEQDLEEGGLDTSSVDLGATTGSPLVSVPDANEIESQGDSVQEEESSSSSNQTAPEAEGDSNKLRRIAQDWGEEQQEDAPIEENIVGPSLLVDDPSMSTADDNSETTSQQEGATDAQPEEEVAKEEAASEHPNDDAVEAAVQNNEKTADLDANASPTPGDATQSSTSEENNEENPNGEAEGSPMTRTDPQAPGSGSSEPVEATSLSSKTTTIPTTPEKSSTAPDADASGASSALTSLTTFAIAILGSTAVAVAAF